MARQTNSNLKQGLKRKLATRWLDGTWVGQDPRTGEHILVIANGRAVRVRSIKRKPVSSRWNAEIVLAIQATPRAPCPKDSSALMEAPTDEAVADGPRLEPEVPLGEPGAEIERPRAMHPRDDDLRELKLTKRLFIKFGYSIEHGVQLQSEHWSNFQPSTSS